MPKPQSDAPRVLIADDQPDVLVALRMLLRDEGYELTTANSPEAILRALDEDSFDAVLMDMNYTRDTTTGKEGLTLLQVIRAQDDTLPVLVMTGWSSVDTAEAIRLKLLDNGIDALHTPCVATGYGRAAIPYANKAVTEITCHAKGACEIFGCRDMTVIDIGGKIPRLSASKAAW